MPVYELLAGPLSCAFWLKPVSPFGLLTFTTVHTQVPLKISDGPLLCDYLRGQRYGIAQMLELLDRTPLQAIRV
jgi:hypothetical protein